MNDEKTSEWRKIVCNEAVEVFSVYSFPIWYSIECVLFYLLVTVQTNRLPTLLCTQTYQPKLLLDLKKLFCNETKVKSDFVFIPNRYKT